MTKFGWLGAAALGVLGFGFAGTAAAQPVVGQPTSALIFPLFDSSPGRGTLITVTNTVQATHPNTARLSCGNGFRRGDVSLHYIYFGFDESFGFCREFDVDHFLTPGDTLTVIADQDNPEGEEGWLWVEARDPETNEAIDFDYLIGSAIVVDLNLDFLDQYLPYGFRAIAESDFEPVEDITDACGRAFTDSSASGGDEDGFADFDGIEYDFWPAILFLDEFFEEGGTNPTFTNELTLASCDLDPRDDDPTHVNFGIWNNREVRFSRSFDFECFFRSSLSDISLVVFNLNGDPNELVSGSRSIQAGWLDITGSDPILGVFFQRIEGQDFAAGRELQFDGQFGGPDDDPNHLPCSLSRS